MAPTRAEDEGLIDDNVVQSFGLATLRSDDINTYIYVAFKQRTGLAGQDLTPIEHAGVDLMDQDVPAEIPTLPDDIVRQGGKFRETISTRFIPPTGNQVLAHAETDDQGRTKFVLLPSQLRTAGGTIVTTRETEDLRSGEVTTRTTRRPFIEALPDIFFKVVTRDGNTIDTRQLAQGFVPNLTTKHLGSADSREELALEDRLLFHYVWRRCSFQSGGLCGKEGLSTS